MSEGPLLAIPLLIAGGASGGIVLVGIAVCGLCWWRRARKSVEYKDPNPKRPYYPLRAPNSRSAAMHYHIFRMQAAAEKAAATQP